MLQMTVSYTVFVARQIYRRGICDGLEIQFTSPLGGIQEPGAPETSAKSVALCSLSVSDYKRVYTSLYFIITNFHTELKPQVKISRDMNSPAFTLYTTFDQL